MLWTLTVSSEYQFWNERNEYDVKSELKLIATQNIDSCNFKLPAFPFM
jgi:hypothetical protein